MLNISENMYLKELSESDADNIFMLGGKENVARYMRFDVLNNMEDAVNLLHHYMENNGYAIFINGIFAGVFAFMNSSEKDVLTLSLFLDKAFWNGGYGTRIICFSKEYAFTVLKAKKLLGYVSANNIGSLRMLEKNGFTVAEVLQMDDVPGGLYVLELTKN